jgi:hypothetical protein
MQAIFTRRLIEYMTEAPLQMCVLHPSESPRACRGAHGARAPGLQELHSCSLWAAAYVIGRAIKVCCIGLKRQSTLDSASCPAPPCVGPGSNPGIRCGRPRVRWDLFAAAGN